MKSIQNSTHVIQHFKIVVLVLFLIVSATRCNDKSETYVPVTSITASIESVTLEIGQKESLTATINPSNATIQRYSWESSNSGVAAVDNSGVVTGLVKGTADIILKTPREGYTDTVKIMVLGPPIDVSVVEGNYSGVVTMNGAPVAADVPLEIQFTSQSTISIDTQATIMGGLMTLHVHGNSISITRNDDIYTISGNAITDNFGYGEKNTTINGTVHSNGTINLVIGIDSISETVAYNGQKI
jgi:uncharacterized protein YjdB